MGSGVFHLIYFGKKHLIQEWFIVHKPRPQNILGMFLTLYLHLGILRYLVNFASTTQPDLMMQNDDRSLRAAVWWGTQHQREEEHQQHKTT